MDSFEFNKIFAAILVAGITVSSVGFIANKLVHPHDVAAHGEAATGRGAKEADDARRRYEP